MAEKPAVTVGTGGRVRRTINLPRVPRPKMSKKTVFYGLIVVLVLAGLWLLAKKQLHIGEKVYAQAAGHKIYKEDVQALIGNTKGVSDHDAAKVLADKYLYEAMAKKGGITVSDQDVKAQYPDAKVQKTRNPYVYQCEVNMVYYNSLIAYNHGLYKGDVLVANFSRNIAFKSPYIGIQEATNPLIGNKAAIAKDKKYAFDFITKLYQGVKDHKITFDQAVQQEHKDPQLGKEAYQTLPHSGPFDTSNVYLPATNLVLPKSIQPKLAHIQAGELSAPFAVRVGNAWKDDSITVESYYLVVRMDYAKGSHSGLSFSKYLAEAKKHYGYKVNV